MNLIFILFLQVLTGGILQSCISEGREEKKELVFLIDEGMCGKELITRYGNDKSAYYKALDNISGSLKPLQSRYTVSVLVYPTWAYNANGFSDKEDVKDGVNRLHPSLRYVLNYFAEKNIGVYLELYSSGIYTNQNGEMGEQPLVSKHYGSEEYVKGFSMDLECVDSILGKYPALKGVRFHELIGSNDLKDNGHGFPIDFDLLVEIAGICAKHNKKLIWSDHSWNLVYNAQVDNRFQKYKIWNYYINKVCDIMGNQLTITFANNGWGSEYESLTYEFPMAGYRNTQWGYSAQSWWWQEIDARALPRWSEECGGGYRWYPNAMFDMPVELMAAFSMCAFQQGASLVQLEPAYYFFNFYKPDMPQYGQCEYIDDYSAKYQLKRYIDMMINSDKYPQKYPSMKPTDYYSVNICELLDNKWGRLTKKYNQTTLILYGNGMESYDTYNSNPSVWFYFQPTSYIREVFKTKVKKAIRVDVLFNLIDEFLVLRDTTGILQADIYNRNGVLLTSCKEMVADNTDGIFVDICALNLEQNGMDYATELFGDPDEIVVLREKKGMINFTVYKNVVADVSSSTPAGFTYVEDSNLSNQLNKKYPSVLKSDYVCVLGMRTSGILYMDNSKSLDELFVFTNGVKGIDIYSFIDNSLQTLHIPMDQDSLINIYSADVDLDWQDELVMHTSTRQLIPYSLITDGTHQYFVESFPLRLFVDVNQAVLPLRYTTYFKE